MRKIDSSKHRIHKERLNVFLTMLISLQLHAILIVYWINYKGDDAPEEMVTVAVNLVTEERPVEIEIEIEEPVKEENLKEETANDMDRLMHDALAKSLSPSTESPEMPVVPEYEDAHDALPTKPPRGFGILGMDGAGVGDGTKFSSIGGNFIRARKLGVLIDVSGSMKDSASDVKKQVEKNFPNSPTLEASGCSLDMETVQSIMEFVKTHKPDTLFWFCDLQDRVSPHAATRLLNYLKRQNVRFYVRTYDQPGCESIRMLVEETGGTIFHGDGLLDKAIGGTLFDGDDDGLRDERQEEDHDPYVLEELPELDLKGEGVTGTWRLEAKAEGGGRTRTKKIIEPQMNTN